jgi:hypothetical protein
MGLGPQDGGVDLARAGASRGAGEQLDVVGAESLHVQEPDPIMQRVMHRVVLRTVPQR